MTLYDDLGLQPSASVEEIKKSYRTLARKHHPDKGGDPEMFKKISQAYDVLSDDGKRRMYDMTGSETGEPQGFPSGFAGGGPFDMFMNMFHGHQGAPGHRGDFEHVIRLTLDEVYHGVEKHLKVEIVKNCFSCLKKCQTCGGRGQVQRTMAFMMMNSPCPTCQGCGSKSSGCPTCNHTKEIREQKELSVKIQAGTQNGDHVLIPHMGEQARTSDEIAGNLILRLQVLDHKEFLREGNDLVIIRKMSFEESVHGTILCVNHFGGEFKLSTQDFGIIDPRQKYKVPGRGMKGGDLYVIFDLQYPPKNVRYVLTDSGSI